MRLCGAGQASVRRNWRSGCRSAPVPWACMSRARRGMGWYFSSIPAQTIIPVSNQDLQLIVLVDQGHSDDSEVNTLPSIPVTPGFKAFAANKIPSRTTLNASTKSAGASVSPSFKI